MLEELVIFFKNPVYQEEISINVTFKIKYFIFLLALSLALSISLGMVISILNDYARLDFGTHALEDLRNTYSPGFILMAAVLVAPVLEELIFRGPLVFFKGNPHFLYIFYAFTAVFGFYHLLNYEITAIVLIFSPLLVAPQLVIGAVLGFLRVRFGLLWAILLHASYNLILIGPILFFHPDQINPL